MIASNAFVCFGHNPYGFVAVNAFEEYFTRGPSMEFIISLAKIIDELRSPVGVKPFSIRRGGLVTSPIVGDRDHDDRLVGRDIDTWLLNTVYWDGSFNLISSLIPSTARTSAQTFSPLGTLLSSRNSNSSARPWTILR